MANNSQDDFGFIYPEKFFKELLSKYVRGDFVMRDENFRIFYRAVVLAIDLEGGRLENPDAAGSLEHIVDGRTVSIGASKGITNPRNSVRARILTDERDQFLDDDELHVFWPMTSEYDTVPIKPGEHVYVFFEDSSFKHGLWYGRVSGHDDQNYFRGQDSFQSAENENSRLTSKYEDSREIVEKDDSQFMTDRVASGRLISTRLTKTFNDDGV